MTKQVKEAHGIYTVKRDTMLQTVEAIFDGKVLRTKDPLTLKPNTRVRITIEAIRPKRGKSKSFLETARSLKIREPRDLSENLDEYLYGSKSFMEVIYKPIGVIHSPFHSLEEMPIQPTSDISAPGSVEIYPEYSDGLKDLEGFSHIYLLYHFHKISQSKLLVTPFLDREPRGIFSTRAPSRPNPIGLSLIKIVRIENNLIHVAQVDVLDGTPVLDIKPYVPEFEFLHDVRIGWIEKAKGQISTRESDARFKQTTS